MNEINLKFDPFQNKCTISMNDAPLPRYSTLNSYINRPLLDVASSLLQTISDELNDDFELSVIGPEFEQKFLKDLQKKHEECIGFSVKEYGVEVTLRDRFNSTAQIAKGLDSVTASKYKERVYIDFALEVDSKLAEKVEGPEEATLCVINSLESAKAIQAKYRGQLTLCVGPENEVICLNTNRYIWCVTEECIAEYTQAVIERFAIPKYIDYVSFAAKQSEDVKARESVENQKKIDVSVSVKMPTSAIEGDCISPEFRTTGNVQQCPTIRIESSNISVVEVSGTQLYAVREGRADIKFYKDNEIDAFETISMTIRPDNLVKTISLSAPEKIKVGNTYKIIAEYAPANAPDIENAKWSTSDVNIVNVNADGTFKAISEGTARISVETERANASIDITVISGVAQIKLSSEKVNMYIGEKKKIDLSLMPPSSLIEEITAKSSNPKVADVSKNEIGEWVVSAKGIEANGNGKGTCRIIFSSEDGDCQSVCQVVVESTMTRNEKNSGFLSRTALCTALGFVLQFITKPLGHYCAVGFAAVAILLGVVGIVKNRRDAFWQIILIIISGFIILVHILPVIG